MLNDKSLLNVTSITDHRTNYDDCVLSEKKSKSLQVSRNNILRIVQITIFMFTDRKSTRLKSSHGKLHRMPASA